MRRRRLLIPLTIAVVAVAAALITRAWFAARDPQLARVVEDAVADCGGATTRDYGDPRRWPHASRATITACAGDVAPAVVHVRFADRAALAGDLVDHPFDAAVCLVGDDAYFDVIGGFAAVCRRLGGDLVDAVSGLPDLPSDGTAGGEDLAALRQAQRDERAQAAALRSYFARHSGPGAG